jgi:hypothetical protein
MCDIYIGSGGRASVMLTAEVGGLLRQKVGCTANKYPIVQLRGCGIAI